MISAQPAPRASEHLHAGLLHAQEFERLGVRLERVLHRPGGGEIGGGLVCFRCGEAEEDLDARSDHATMHYKIDEIVWYNQALPVFHDTHPCPSVEQALCNNISSRLYYNFEWQLSRFVSGKNTQFERRNNGVSEKKELLPPVGTGSSSSAITRHYRIGSGPGSRRGTVLPPGPHHGRHHSAERLPISEFRWRGANTPKRCACGRAPAPQLLRLGRFFSTRIEPPGRTTAAGANAGRPFELQNHTHQNHHALTARQRGGPVTHGSSSTWEIASAQKQFDGRANV
jgi:hypothetical protein